MSDMVLASGRPPWLSWSAVGGPLARPVFPRRLGRLLNCCAVSSFSSSFLFSVPLPSPVYFSLPHVFLVPFDFKLPKEEDCEF